MEDRKDAAREPRQETGSSRRGGENHEMSRVKEKERESQGKNCCRSLWMDLSNLTVRIRRGLERDKERDYNQKEPVAELLVRKHLKACYEVDTVEYTKTKTYRCIVWYRAASV